MDELKQIKKELERLKTENVELKRQLAVKDEYIKSKDALNLALMNK